MKESKKAFHKVKNLKQFKKLWSKFYTNEICIPTYLDNFVGGEDNPQATIEMGKKFQEIVSYGIIPDDFQTNSLKDTQKAYVDMFVPNNLANVLTSYINRYPGYVAFWQHISNDDSIKGLYVTYDPTEKDTEMSLKTNVFFGDPYSHLGYGGEGTFESIQEWLNNNAKKHINKNNFKHMVVIDTMFNEKPDRILDIILYALRDNLI